MTRSNDRHLTHDYSRDSPAITSICWDTSGVHSPVLAACQLILDMHWLSGVWAVWSAAGLVARKVSFRFEKNTTECTADINLYHQTSLNSEPCLQLSLWKTFHFKYVFRKRRWIFLILSRRHSISLDSCIYEDGCICAVKKWLFVNKTKIARVHFTRK